ncbi:MAG TPA: hypothetical protein VMP01_03350 [Pirellulaceae bacterium]|nr:hypothetical protein [Pirellulaceae bacterium]
MVAKIHSTFSNVVLAPLIVAAVLDLAGWGWWLHAGHAQQGNHLTKHDGEIATLQRDSDRILTNLDEILRELLARK